MNLQRYTSEFKDHAVERERLLCENPTDLAKRLPVLPFLPGFCLLESRESRSPSLCHPQGSALDATVSENYLYSSDSRRRADRVIWAGLGRLPDVVEDVPTIVVEFVSEGRRSWMRDYIEKRDDYLALGVVEYWVIDRFAREMTVFNKTDEQVEETVVKQDGIYQTPLLPGFELALAKLLAVADRWRKE